MKGIVDEYETERWDGVMREWGVQIGTKPVRNEKQMMSRSFPNS